MSSWWIGIFSTPCGIQSYVGIILVGKIVLLLPIFVFAKRAHEIYWGWLQPDQIEFAHVSIHVAINLRAGDCKRDGSKHFAA